MTSSEGNDPAHYDDPDVLSADAPVPRWLFAAYILLPIWGFACFYLFWNGSQDWVSGRYWQQLQRAANTTFPVINQNISKDEAKN